ncbi:hypothetical protein GXW82_28610 [Streptacidiphilus sp. 4-A2]|nr:hypothetical protein [Streptacidiphilus sp. 4-A2]
MSEDLLGELPAEAVELYLQAVETGSIPMDPSPAAPDTQAPAAPDYRQRCSTSGC